MGYLDIFNKNYLFIPDFGGHIWSCFTNREICVLNNPYETPYSNIYKCKRCQISLGLWYEIDPAYALDLFSISFKIYICKDFSDYTFFKYEETDFPTCEEFLKIKTMNDALE